MGQSISSALSRDEALLMYALSCGLDVTVERVFDVIGWDEEEFRAHFCRMTLLTDLPATVPDAWRSA